MAKLASGLILGTILLVAAAPVPTVAATKCSVDVVYVECYGICRADVLHAGFDARVHCAGVFVLECGPGPNLLDCTLPALM